MPRPGTLPGQPVLPAAAASAYGGGGVPAAAPVHSASDAVAALRASAKALVQPGLASGSALQNIAPGVAPPNLHDEWRRFRSAGRSREVHTHSSHLTRCS